MNSKTGFLAVTLLMILGGLPVLSGCAPPMGWGTEVTATSLQGDQWKVDVVITQHPNRKHAQDRIVSAPTLICRSGETAEMWVGGPDRDQDSIKVHVDTAKDPSTDEMAFTVTIRDGGWLRSRTLLKVQPQEDAPTASATASDTGSK